MLTWVGHATALIDVGGFRILTDPVVARRLAHLVRRVPVVDVGLVDAVLVSHLHMDHLHRASLRRVARGARVVAPTGAAPLLSGLGVAGVDEVRPGELVEFTPPGSRRRIEVEAVHAEHHSGRGPHTRRRAQPVGYVVRVDGVAIYFAGDTGPFAGMRDLGPIDVALLPIWGWGRTIGDLHLDPTTATAATDIIRPRHVVPIHWGTYSPVNVAGRAPRWLPAPLQRFRRDLVAADLGQRLVALSPGGSVELDARGRAVTTGPGTGLLEAKPLG